MKTPEASKLNPAAFSGHATFGNSHSGASSSMEDGETPKEVEESQAISTTAVIINSSICAVISIPFAFGK